MGGTNPTLTEAAVRDLARPQSFDRGENYYDDGAVVEVVRRGETIRATVEGSQYEPYQVRIELDETGVVDTACSCPYDHGGICKHRVAVLLAYVRDSDEIDQRPPVSELIADADPGDLRDVLVDLVDSRPELAAQVESRLETARSKNADDDTRDHTPDIDRESIRQQVQYVLRPTEGRSAHAYDPYEAVETDVETLRDLLDQARTAVEAGDGETALDVIEPLADELMDEGWLALSHDDSGAIFEFFDEVDKALAEALLTADLSEEARADWEDRLWNWEQEMGSYTVHPPYSVALEAAQRGWDFEPVQRAMQGNIGYADLWEGDPPWYAETFIRTRLNVLERQDRIEEYLHLAEAADLIDEYVTTLVEQGRIEEAIEYGRHNLYSPDEALALARALREHDRPEAAIEIAHHGVSLDDSSGKAELAEWLRDRAASLDEPDVALEAAIAAFEASPSLAAYQATEELAGEDWPDVREALLESLRDRETRPRTARRHVEIFLHAEEYGPAIAIADRVSDYKVVEPVVEAVWEEHPRWTIDACKEQAEPIIEEGQSQRYRHAVEWLEYAGKAAQVSGELDEWRSHVEDLRDEHYRKYKLRPMLEELLEAFPE